jgi:hypothetical protein
MSSPKTSQQDASLKGCPPRDAGGPCRQYGQVPPPTTRGSCTSVSEAWVRAGGGQPQDPRRTLDISVAGTCRRACVCGVSTGANCQVWRVSRLRRS